MKTHNTKFLIVSIACVLFSLYGMQAQAQELLNYPLDTINGVEVYRYHVDKGIGVYRIGVNFNVSQDVLYRWNPELRNGVKYNQLIYIPTGRPVTGSKSQNVARAQQPSTPPQRAEQKPVVVESRPVVVESRPVVVESKPVVVDSRSAVVESRSVVVSEPRPVVETKPVVVESKPQSRPAVAATQPAPVVREQQIESGRTIVIGPRNKNSNADPSISTIYIGPNRKDNSRSGEVDVIRIGPKQK